MVETVRPGKIMLHAPDDTHPLIGTYAMLRAENGNTKALGPFVAKAQAVLRELERSPDHGTV